MKLSTAMMNYVNAFRAKGLANEVLGERVKEAMKSLEGWQSKMLTELMKLARDKHFCKTLRLDYSTSKFVVEPHELAKRLDAWEDLAEMVADEIEE